MSTTYLMFPTNVPSDGSLCFVRPVNYSVVPFKAFYEASTQSFISQVNSIIYPQYSIYKWKYA